MTFESFDFSPKLRKTITEAGYTTPTPIQAKAIPEVLSGRDVIGLAQTGTGKTAAFVLPILQRMIAEREQRGPENQTRRDKNPSALVLAPTRELAEQINDVIKQLGRGTGIRSTVIIGGVSQRPQIEALKQGLDIVVACPGRLIDLVEQRFCNLSQIRFLVLDEADQMFDMGFFPSLRRILGWLPKSRQSLFFSATMPSEISGLANEVLNKPAKVEASFASPVSTVTHAIFNVGSEKKADLLTRILPELGEGSVLIFTRTKHRAKKLGQQLDKLGYRATSLQGNLSQNRRKEAMDGFRKGAYQIMVATDIAARGIDISSVTHVINFDVPETPEAYTHRIGRTGRAARTGDAFTFVTSEDLSMIRAIERRLGKPIERRELEGFDHSLPKEIADPQDFRNRRGGRGDRRGRDFRGAAGGSNQRGGNGRSGQNQGERRQPRSDAPQAGAGRAQSSAAPQRNGNSAQGRQDGSQRGNGESRRDNNRGRDPQGRDSQARDFEPRAPRPMNLPVNGY